MIYSEYGLLLGSQRKERVNKICLYHWFYSGGGQRFRRSNIVRVFNDFSVLLGNDGPFLPFYGYGAVCLFDQRNGFEGKGF